MPGDAPLPVAGVDLKGLRPEALYREVALGTFTDKLGEDVALDMLSTGCLWQQRFDTFVATPDSPWLDDPRTPDLRETLADVIRKAAPRAPRSRPHRARTRPPGAGARPTRCASSARCAAAARGRNCWAGSRSSAPAAARR
jgi:hypothetical protein